MFRPDDGDPDQLADLLRGALRWRSYVLVIQKATLTP